VKTSLYLNSLPNSLWYGEELYTAVGHVAQQPLYCWSYAAVKPQSHQFCRIITTTLCLPTKTPPLLLPSYLSTVTPLEYVLNCTYSHNHMTCFNSECMGIRNIQGVFSAQHDAPKEQ